MVQPIGKKLILDLDTGIDDALAIAYALGSPEADLIGITGTYGNVLVEQGVSNALAILDLFGRPDIPVYSGLPHSSTGRVILSAAYFSFYPWEEWHWRGADTSVLGPSEPTDAVDFIIESAHRYGENLIYVPTGPLTNLAAALQRDPGIAGEIGKIVLMGGALTVSGNVSPCAEANISQDPEAADYVFRHAQRITMVGLDVTLQTLLTRKHTQQWRDLHTDRGDFLAEMTDYYIKAYETTAPNLGGCGLHDPLAVGVAVDPSLVGTLPVNLKVDTEDPTRGRTIGDVDRLNDPDKTAQAAVTVDVQRFLDEFMSRISGLAA